MGGLTKLLPVVLSVLGEALGVPLPLVTFCWQGAAEGVSSSGGAGVLCLPPAFISVVALCYARFCFCNQS